MSSNTETHVDTSNRRLTAETKPATKTSELIAFVVAVAATLIAALVVDGFDAARAWLFVTILTTGYMISRGLAKSGSRAHYSNER